MHGIGRQPTRDCQGCNEDRCPAALCPLCREEPDKPAHLLLRCPALMTRYTIIYNIHPELEEALETGVVAALAAAARRTQSRLATTV